MTPDRPGPLGSLRIDETTYPITAVRLARGAIRVYADIPGPVNIPQGTMIMVYGDDGGLIIRGRLSGPIVLAEDEVGCLDYNLYTADKLTDAARRGPAR